MLTNIHTLFSESTDHHRVPDRKPLQLDELQTLIRMTAECGYCTKDAHDMVPPYDVFSTELYAVWYSIEHEIPIFPDNIHNLIDLTGWNRSSPHVFDNHLDQGVSAPIAMAGG